MPIGPLVLPASFDPGGTARRRALREALHAPGLPAAPVRNPVPLPPAAAPGVPGAAIREPVSPAPATAPGRGPVVPVVAAPRDRVRPPGTEGLHPQISPQVLRDIADLLERGSIVNEDGSRIDPARAERFMHEFMEELKDDHRHRGHGNHLPRGHQLTLMVFRWFCEHRPRLVNEADEYARQLRREGQSMAQRGRLPRTTHEDLERAPGHTQGPRRRDRRRHDDD
ncbi:hypothetical protein [Amycolatopsis rifamycinica]|uniref:Uncharacterized protein n=1 Tax=Amycolatopsis rifamycinica TaxID=287986 RepID=A0A066UEK4_9PSEU|nr:hypothetical protein [Amycolatopsis rifamycinica]KDN22628.1 hypothetical protein DV20_08835 [Amycolatopsis rifamycinica]